jgi:sugar phosphate isomerase/epimerase
MSASLPRRALFKKGGLLAAGGAAALVARPSAAAEPERPLAAAGKPPLFKISLAQWSLHNALQGNKLDNLDFAVTANRLGFDAIEYVNQFFFDKAKDRKYLAELKRRAAGEGVWSVLIMVDREPPLGAADPARRKQAAESHFKWVEAAAFLGCHAIRVNAQTDKEGSDDDKAAWTAEGLRRLVEFGDQQGINVIVENHGGLSSDPAWLSKVMKTVNHPRCGTLPDFGNFYEHDRYAAVETLMPFARSVSAKSHEFDKKGNETATDYQRMMKIVVAAGYHGYVGVEYEGKTLPELDGIMATRRLLERVRTRLATG